MPAKRSGLGRGLETLLPKPEKGIQYLSLSDLTVSEFQPRKTIDPKAIAELAASVADKGVLQPLLVRPAEKGYEIVAGERRFRAAKQAGLSNVPAIIKDLSDQETLEVAIIENLQREDLNPVEEARAFKQLLGFGLNQEAVAKAVGKSRSAVANTLRLLNLPEKALEGLEKGRLTAGHARAILSQPEDDQAWLFNKIVNEGLSVRQAEGLERKAKPSKKGRSASDGRYEDLEGELTRFVGSRVKISGGSKGKIELHFHSVDELERLIEMLGYQA